MMKMIQTVTRRDDITHTYITAVTLNNAIITPLPLPLLPLYAIAGRRQSFFCFRRYVMPHYVAAAATPSLPPPRYYIINI